MEFSFSLGHYFVTTEVIEAESQAVLTVLTKHDFQDAFKNGMGAGNGAHARKGTTSKVMMWPVVLNLVLDQMAAPVPEIVLHFRILFPLCILT
jgi:hypothetical protein